MSAEGYTEPTGAIEPSTGSMDRGGGNPSTSTDGIASNPVVVSGEVPMWQDFANCLGVDPDLFFPERGASSRAAKEVCRGCVVRADCLEYALENGEKFGIWGGMSERERRRFRRQRALAARAIEPAPELPLS